KVRLEDDPAGTRLSYDVDAAVGGKLAQIGGRLIASTAKKLADEFFAKFGELAAQTEAGASAVTAEPESDTVAAMAQTGGDPGASQPPHGNTARTWLIIAIVALVLVILVGASLA
ncbi:MAG: SRPBCC domain-containing protein, partial [Rhodospirillaceae bacterium]